MPSDLPVLENDVDCCTPATHAPLADEVALPLAARFKALGDPTRVKLLALIAESSTAEACICDLTAPIGLSQPTISHHMKQLVDAGLVTSEKRGRWVFYRLVPDALTALASTLTALPHHPA
ncbi:metalloregulator ArsR/SmtB family transcription factor [Nocardioides sp.]|uniref:ArsR/SmtB family transcription factor n=1 Tax=Nocardioides sp. TaxID=35761 RepID=UPI0026029A37|nr:metalloregulator ArsR/SmtB family transcription factor [Nocardioides sp.]